jgi:hypothetical protein
MFDLLLELIIHLIETVKYEVLLFITFQRQLRLIVYFNQTLSQVQDWELYFQRTIVLF